MRLRLLALRAGSFHSIARGLSQIAFCAFALHRHSMDGSWLQYNSCPDLAFITFCATLFLPAGVLLPSIQRETAAACFKESTATNAFATTYSNPSANTPSPQDSRSRRDRRHGRRVSLYIPIRSTSANERGQVTGELGLRKAQSNYTTRY
ncbi:hypothetical protein BDZ89DRAFT_1063602 [Hymenopellis radicata]|nr:hypothetical protein BDZ89DRAFT_1063602 [Hymenopellis radicata]